MKTTTERVHFIAIDENASLNLAIALHKKGYSIAGSGENISESVNSKLTKAGILNFYSGWNSGKISSDINAVIIGVTAKEENPELKQAQKLGLKVYSFAEYIYKESIDKQRIVVTGSHGKTVIASMVMHVLKYHNRKFDYVINTEPNDFEASVKLSDDAPVIIIEGKENPSSSIDKKAQFLHYHHHIGVLTGVSWNYIDEYPVFDEYVKQFELFADQSPKGGTLVFNENDDLATMICRKERDDVQRIEYNAHKNEIEKEKTYLNNGYVKISVQVFGKQNMKNISGAKAVCLKIGITEDMFYKAIQQYKGISNRIELLEKKANTSIYRDYAHAPIQLKTCTNAVKKQFASKELTTVYELHTYSSLSKSFLSQYKDTLKSSDDSVIYYNPQNIESKKLSSITTDELIKAFDNPRLKVFTEKQKVEEYLLSKKWNNANLLIMVSDSPEGLDSKDLARKIVAKL